MEKKKKKKKEQKKKKEKRRRWNSGERRNTENETSKVMISPNPPRKAGTVSLVIRDIHNHVLYHKVEIIPVDSDIVTNYLI